MPRKKEGPGQKLGKQFDRYIGAPLSSFAEKVGETVNIWKEETQRNGDAFEIANAVECMRHRMSKDAAVGVLNKFNKDKGYGITMQDVMHWQTLGPAQRKYAIEMKIYNVMNPPEVDQ